MPSPDERYIILWKHTDKEQNRELCFETKHVLKGTKQQEDDVDITLEEWKDMLRQIPTLKCNRHCPLASGSKTSLPNRLFAYFALGHASTTRTRPVPQSTGRRDHLLYQYQQNLMFPRLLKTFHHSVHCTRGREKLACTTWPHHAGANQQAIKLQRGKVQHMDQDPSHV